MRALLTQEEQWRFPLNPPPTSEPWARPWNGGGRVLVWMFPKVKFQNLRRAEVTLGRK